MRARRGDDLRELKETEERYDSLVAEAETEEGRRRLAAAAVVVAAAEREVIAAALNVSRSVVGCVVDAFCSGFGGACGGSYLKADSLLFPFLQFFQVNDAKFCICNLELVYL